MGHKRALIVGINYVGTGHDLSGCINDAKNMDNLLRTKFGFTDVKLVLEKEATTQNIKDQLRWLVSGCRPGDTLFFHYSGHGSQMLDTSDDELDDSLDEIICPIDLDWREKVITDDYLKWVFDTVPAGVNLTVFLDCCNSGSGLDQTNQYQPLGVGRSTTEPGRYLPPPPEMQELMKLVGAQPKTRTLQSREVNQTGLLISGCQAHQTSADAFINGVWQGAATYSLLRNLDKFNYDITYKQLVEEMNDFMVDYNYTQRPELNGHPSLFELKFAAAPDVTTEDLNEYEPVDIPPVPSTEQQPVEQVLEVVVAENKRNDVIKAIVIAIGLLAAMYLLG